MLGQQTSSTGSLIRAFRKTLLRKRRAQTGVSFSYSGPSREDGFIILRSDYCIGMTALAGPARAAERFRPVSALSQRALRPLLRAVQDSHNVDDSAGDS